MYKAVNENALILVDIVDTMVDYCSIQPDIDESKIKAAAVIAQKIDIELIIGKANVQRCIDPSVQADIDFRDLVMSALCFYTYSRLLKMFPGTFTDGGYMIEKDASDKNVTRQVSNEYATVAEAYMVEVLAFLKSESPNDKAVHKEKLVKRIRTIGGKEHRASN